MVDVLAHAHAGGRVSRRLRTMRLGDLNDSELLPFLEFLAKTIASEDAATRFTALWETEEQLTAFRNRYGGYVSDIVALRNLHNNAAAAPGAHTASRPGTYEHGAADCLRVRMQGAHRRRCRTPHL
jgi:hypothetical protein